METKGAKKNKTLLKRNKMGGTALPVIKTYKVLIIKTLCFGARIDQKTTGAELTNRPIPDLKERSVKNSGDSTF